MAYQLCMRDEYGQGSIIASDSDLEKITKRCKQEINSVNVDNALTIDDKKKNWESFMVVIESPETDEMVHPPYVYAGKDGRGVDQVFDAEDTTIKLSDIESRVTLKMFLGTLDGEDWFAAVPSRTKRGEEDLIDSLTHEAMQAKNIYFIRPV